MANIHLHSGSKSSVTCVSNYFIDHFLKDLSGDAVRVYLTLLRALGDRDRDFSISGVASGLSVSAREVRTSLDALASAGLVGLDYDSEGELCDICIKDCEPQTDDEDRESVMTQPQPEAGKEQGTVAVETADPAPSVFSAGRVSAEPSVPEMIEHSEEDCDSPEMRQIIFITQRYFGRSLSPQDLRIILYWYYDLGMDSDMIDYLITSNFDNGRTSLAYMNKVAISWWKKGIRTPDQASLEQKQFSTETNTVRRAFGITGHVMTPAELEYIDRWFHEWGFGPEIVQLACERTITSIGNPNYNYADTILSSWHDKGYTSVEQITEDDDAHTRESRQKYQGRNTQQKKSGFGFSETNKYDDNAIASVLLKHSTF